MGLGLERIVYTSRARGNADRLMLQVDILAVSQRNNARDALTGALLIHDGRFLQVLEGAGQDLDRLMKRLATDPRHDEVVVIERTAIVARRFSGWAMASVQVTPALEALLRDAVGGAIPAVEAVDRMQDAAAAQA